MKALLTGMRGTVAPAVEAALLRRGHDVAAWNRDHVPTDDLSRINHFMDEVAPDIFFHIATGPAHWAELVARICYKRNIRFLFTSSVSVFSENGSGPYSVHAEPDASDDYGRYKRECEQLVRGANPEAYIARLGWQIGHAAGSNNMVDYLQKTMSNDGKIAASDSWIPSCSFLEDTADALVDLVEQHPPGIYHLNGNPRWTFYKIATALNAKHGNIWVIEKGSVPSRDDTLLEDRINVCTIDQRLTR